MTINCPNCDAEMEEKKVCPKCDHDDGDKNCYCGTCQCRRESIAKRAELRRELEQARLDEISDLYQRG